MRVRVWTAAPPAETTSAVAAALWYPYRAYPAERVAVWGQSTFEELARLAGDPGTGVHMVPGVELWRRSVPDPEWGGGIPGLRRIPPAELPAGYADGHAVTVPVAHMGIYLGYLADRFAAGGGRLELRTVRVLARAAHSAPLVVNCTGLGARALAGDDTVVPVRGQVVRVENPGVDRFWLDEEHPDGLTYIVPRGEDCILGGTAEEGGVEHGAGPGGRARHRPALRGVGAAAGGGAHPGAPRRAAAGASLGAAGGGGASRRGARHPLLRAWRRGRHAFVGVRGRCRRARPPHIHLTRTMTEPWHPGETPEEQAARREAYQRLVDAAGRIGVPLQHLRDGLRQVAHNEAETRRFLAEDVYGVPDDLLDDMVRIRFAELDESG